MLPTVAPTRRRALGFVAAIFTFVFAVYILTASADIFSTGDTTIRIQLAENILGRASVELHGWQLQFPRHIKKEYLDPRLDVGRGGKTYSTYLLGQPLAIMPFEKLGAFVAIRERWPYGPTIFAFDRLVGPLFGALEVTLFFLFAVRLGYGLRKSLLLSAVFAFATSVWPDEQSVLEHTEVAFFLLLGTYFAFRFRQQGRSQLYLAYSGAGIGGAAITRYQDAFIGCLAIGLYLLLPTATSTRLLTRVRWLFLFGLGLVPFALIDVWYSWIRFNSFTATGHHEKLFGYPLYLGVPGLLVSPGKGLLLYSPVVLLLAIAGPRFWRQYSALSLCIAVLVCGFLVLYGQVTFWHGDPAWGPRYIYPLLPFLVLPLGELFSLRGRSAPLLGILAVAVILGSFTIQVAAVTVNPWRTWYRVISYEENKGYAWTWIASRYRYFWDPHESPLNFQIHGLYQMAYDTLTHSKKYELVPPDEDPILDRMTTDYAINQWGMWWTSNEFNWWMGERKIALGVIMLLSIIVASGTYITGEAAGVFSETTSRRQDEPVPEAA